MSEIPSFQQQGPADSNAAGPSDTRVSFVRALLLLFHAEDRGCDPLRKHYLMENMTISISPKYQLVFGRHRVKRNVFFKNIDRDALFNILELQDMFIR
jgi:hypothetical protein